MKYGKMRIMRLGIVLAIWFGLLLQASNPCRDGAEAYKNKDYERAEALLQQCLEQHSEEIGPYLTICAFYQSQNRKEELYEIASRGLQKFPEAALQALENLAKDGQLNAFKHTSFWQPMDTLRDKNLLDDLWKSGQAPWKVWND